MITKLILSDVASYKTEAKLDLKNRVNLIYGLNGTGKSTVSNYLYDLSGKDFLSCKIEYSSADYEILVYNQKFINDTFFEPENLNGIFTLSKENREAEKKIENANKELKNFNNQITAKKAEVLLIEKELEITISSTKNTVWQIKKDYSGGDRVLEFCLEGFRNDSQKLLSHIENFSKPLSKPIKTIDNLKTETHELSGDNAQKISIIEKIEVYNLTKEQVEILANPIIGNNESIVSDLINKLDNSDWVKQGLSYVDESSDKIEKCPFCQEQTITINIINKIKDYFDEEYEKNIGDLNRIRTLYADLIQNLPSIEFYELNPKFKNFKKDFIINYDHLIQILESNDKVIKDKLQSPSLSLEINEISTSLDKVNNIISLINIEILAHNKKINQIEGTYKSIKQTFWEILRWDYDPSLQVLINVREKSKKTREILDNDLAKLHSDITEQETIIGVEQKKTINIQNAISNINNSLLDLGIDDFKIKHFKDKLYKIVRENNDDKIFRTLSEGEKMIISFLYFIELCKGKKIQQK